MVCLGTDLVIVILKENVVPFVPFIGNDFILMQNNFRAQTASSTQA